MTKAMGKHNEMGENKKNENNPGGNANDRRGLVERSEAGRSANTDG